MNIYVASNNKGKIEEISNIFSNNNIFSQADIEEKLGIKLDLKENGKTFAENATIKAQALASALGNLLKEKDIVIADDSGILIPSLPEFLGVYTKRQMEYWCKSQTYNATEADFYNHISSITPKPNTCIFEVVIAAIIKNKCYTYTSKIEGKLAKNCRGNNGFGFDPIFEIGTKTLAEMSNSEKATINPRVDAIKKMTNDVLYQIFDIKF